jgi:hypothetical protein
MAIYTMQNKKEEQRCHFLQSKFIHLDIGRQGGKIKL